MRTASVLDRLLPGLTNPVLDSQRIFRAALEAFSNPGRAVALPLHLDAPSPLQPATAAFLLAMADHETPVWLQECDDEPAEYLRFHCGAAIVSEPSAATFAVASDASRIPDFAAFNVGQPEYPDRSTTLLIQVERLHGGRPVILRGPGVKGVTTLDVGGLGADFWARRKRNDALFPCGVDVLFTCGSAFCALPRTTITEA